MKSVWIRSYGKAHLIDRLQILAGKGFKTLPVLGIGSLKSDHMRYYKPERRNKPGASD